MVSKSNSPKISQTFANIFNTVEEADWAFDFGKNTLKKLNIVNPGDSRTAITFPAEQKLHIDFCSWLIVGFEKDKNNDLIIAVTLLEDEVKNTSYKKNYFTMMSGEPQVVLVEIPLTEFRSNDKLQGAFDRTMEFVKDRFKNHSGSPYRKSNQAKIEEAVFNSEKRDTLLQTDLSVIPEEDSNYFWLTADPAIWSFDNIKNGGTIDYSFYGEKGKKRKIISAFKKAKPGDKVLFYESTPKKIIVGQGEVIRGLHVVEKPPQEKAEEAVSFRYIENIEPISWKMLNDVEGLEESTPIRNSAQGSLFEITKDEFETILSLEPVKEVDTGVKIPSISFEKEISVDDLHFEEKEHLIRQIHTALKNNKHIILTGPPGTGKSKLAKYICASYQADYSMATATSDWSTYETIGGYMPLSDGTLRFKPGLFLECFKDLATYHPTNKWLIVDEMNRADIDKAFGPLFSALTGDPVALNLQSESGKSVTLRPEDMDEGVTPNDFEYIIPEDWRLIGTINTLDKASLYEMSYAFMRRFAFIPVGVPKNIDKALIDILLEKWGVTDYPYGNELVFVWKQINAVRQIGPAIVEDIAKYTHIDDDFTSAIILYVLPQFEGLLDQDIEKFINNVGQSERIDKERLNQFAIDFFHL